MHYAALLMDRRSARVGAHYDRLAGRYDTSMAWFERVFVEDGRQWAAARALGETLEIGIGTGRNLEYYPPEVRLTGVDVSQGMLAVARARASALGRTVELRVGSAEDLGFADAAYDSVVGTLVLCSVPDDRAVIAEVARVLRPGGRLILVEHVRSPVWAVRMVQRVLEPVLVRVEHDYLTREPQDHLQGLGFTVEVCERTRWGVIERLVARR